MDGAGESFLLSHCLRMLPDAIASRAGFAEGAWQITTAKRRGKHDGAADMRGQTAFARTTMLPFMAERSALVEKKGQTARPQDFPRTNPDSIAFSISYPFAAFQSEFQTTH